MSTLPPRADLHGNEWPATPAEVDRAEATAARIRREVAEIRTAADQLTHGSPFEAAVAAFLNTEATILERQGGTAPQAELLRPHQDTREQPGMFPTAARSALIIARAHLGQP